MSTLQFGHPSGLATAVGTVNLNGGTLTAANVVQANGTGTFNFNGGTLMPSGNNTAFMTGLSAANVMQNGANINSNGNNITIGQSLQHAGSNNVDGGLVKSGPGTLTLTATQGYNGATIVTGGVLQLSNPNLAAPPWPAMPTGSMPPIWAWPTAPRSQRW